MKSKKTTITVVLAALCLNFSAYAQAKQPIKFPQLGDRVADLQFEQLLNYSSTKAKLSDFKQKAVILDYWATWCGSCIATFLKTDSLQGQFSKHLQFLLINNSPRDDHQKVAAFLNKFKKDHPNFSLPLVMGNTASRKLFPKGSLPHYIWIGYDRKIKAITGPEAVTHANLERLVAGLPLDIPLKEGYHEQ